jgi:hypothetical protein
MRLFRRRDQTLNEQLLREAGFTAEGQPVEAEPRAEDASRELDPILAQRQPSYLRGGAYGVERARRWDAVVSAVDRELPGDGYGFVALPDGSLVVDEDSDETQDLDKLANAVEHELPRPYRAIAVRASSDVWSVVANRVEILELPGFDGDEIQLTRIGEVVTFTVDGRVRPDPPRALLRRDGDFALEAFRLDETLFETRVSPL